MLIEDGTENALTVRGFKTDPDTPIIAKPKRSYKNQKWKCFMPFVSINYITFYHVLESIIKCHHSKSNFKHRCLSEPIKG